MGCMSSIDYNRAVAEAEATRKLKFANAEAERRLGLQHIGNLKTIHGSEASLDAEKKVCELLLTEQAKLEGAVTELQKKLIIPHTIVPTTQAAQAVAELRSQNAIKLAEIRTLADVERRISITKAAKDIEEVYASQAFQIEKGYHAALHAAEVQYAEVIQALEKKHLERLVEEEAQAAVAARLEASQTPSYPHPDDVTADAKPPALDLAEKKEEQAQNHVGFTVERSFVEDTILVLFIVLTVLGFVAWVAHIYAPKEFDEIRQIIIA